MSVNRVSETMLALLAYAAITCSSPATAQTAAAEAAATAPTGAAVSSPVEEAIGNVLNLIEVETQIATTSRMNADYVPGILTVLRGSDLEERGLLTVWEALATVPGITVSMSRSGEMRAIERGVGSTYAPSTLKMMLNGISLNSTLNGKASALFDLSSEQIERIEIIRGPGAVLYGEYASAGVINVITRQGSNRVFARAGSADTRAGGAILSVERPAQAFGISLNIAGWNAGDTGVTMEKDSLTGSPLGSFSRAPGPTNEDHQNFSGILALRFRDFSLTAQAVESKYGDYFGFNDILPDPGRKKVQGDDSLSVEAVQKVGFSPLTSAYVKVGWLLSTRDWSAEVLPAGVRLGWETYFPDGLFQNVSYRESRTYAETSLSTKVDRTHALLLGLGASYTSVVDADRDENGAAAAWIGDDTHRRLLNAFLQDEFEVTDWLTVTGGLRYDSYDDVGDRLTPRVSAVYRFLSRHIFKAQYAEAFRPPVFLEVVGFAPNSVNPDIEPELTRTFEVGYIYKNTTNDVRLTAFHSKIESLIVLAGDQGAADPDSPSMRLFNSGSATAIGGEAEVIHRFGRSVTADANVSYVKTEDSDSGSEIEGATSWLGNLSLSWQPHRRVSLAATNRYVGKRHRSGTDSREDLGAYDAIDLVLNVYDLPVNAVTVRAGVKNLFDAAVRYPSVSTAWEDDLLRPGRQWWVQVSYAF